MNNRGIQHHIAPFPNTLQWFSDNKVLAKIVEEGLLLVRSYLTKVLAISTLMIPTTSGGNKANLKIEKATA